MRPGRTVARPGPDQMIGTEAGGSVSLKMIVSVVLVSASVSINPVPPPLVLSA
jgi:hypothetical protein